MSPRRITPQQKKQNRSPRWLILGGLVAFVVLAALVAADFLAKNQPPAAPSQASLTLNGIPASGRTLGDPKASIVMTEYSDFQ